MVSGLDPPPTADNHLLINAINDAVFNPNPLSETQPRCPTGNCTWPLFTSLGFCVKCQNISQRLQNSSTYDKHNKSECDVFNEGNGTYSSSTCNITTRDYAYRFPELNGQVLETYTNEKRSFSTSIDFYALIDPAMYSPVPVFLVIRLNRNNKTAFNFTDGTSVWTTAFVTLIQISTQYPDYGDVLTADLCALSFCAQRRNVSVSLNRLSSTILQTVYGTNVVHQVNSSKPSTEWLSFTGENFNMTSPSQVNETDYLDRFVSNWEDNLSTVMFSLEGNLTVNSNVSDDSFATSNIMAAFNASSNMSMTMDNIVTTLTNYYRDSSNVTVSGQAGQTEFYVQVSWPWITLPAFLVIAGNIFLILAMFETKRPGARIRKNSEVALLFHGLEESDQELSALHTSSGIEHVASGTRVKVATASGSRWILRRERMRAKSI